MSEQKETVESKPARKQSSKQSSGSSGAFLAMLIALASGGGSYYVWQQHLIAEQDRLALKQRIEQLLDVIEEKDRAQLARIEQLATHQHSGVEQRLIQLEQTLPDLSQQLSLQQQEWNLAEIDYLLRLAEHRLQLSHDIPTTIAALSQARDQLLRYGNGRFSTLTTAIEQAVDQLATVEQGNIGQVTTQLSKLLAELDSLPFAVRAEPGESIPRPALEPLAEGAETLERVKHWGRMVWRDIRSLVTIRRSDEINHPLMNPEQRFFLQAQLRLKLETARLAAIGHNQPLYLASLQEAASWINRYYDTGRAEVAETAVIIGDLSAISVDPELPSLQALRQQLHTAEAQQPAAAPAPTEPEAQPQEAAPFTMESPAEGSL